MSTKVQFFSFVTELCNLSLIFLCLWLYRDEKKEATYKNLMVPCKELSGKLKAITVLVVITVLIVALSITGLFFTVLSTFCLLAALYLIARNIKLLKIKDIVISFVLSLIVLITMLKEEPLWILFNVLPTALLYLAGIILIRKMGFFPESQHSNPTVGFIKRVVIGILIVLPSAILNSLADMGDDNITEWWHPFLAIKPAIFEEIFLRLFLLTFLLYVLSKLKTFKVNALFSPSL